VSDRSLLSKSVLKWWDTGKPKPDAWYQYLGQSVAFSGDAVVVSAPGDPIDSWDWGADDEEYYDGKMDQPAEVREYALGKEGSDGAAPRVLAALALAAAVALAL